MGKKEAKSVVADMVSENGNTPDLPYLQSHFQFIPLFVYANERKNFSEQMYTRGYQMVGRGVTADKSFLMFRDTRFHCPLVFDVPTAPTANRIFGEVYLVSPETILSLDATYERGYCSRRQQVRIEYTNPTDTIKKVYASYATMYTYDWSVFEDRIKNKDLQLHNMFVEQTTGKCAYMWLFGDDLPNQERLASLRNVSKAIEDAKKTGAKEPVRYGQHS
jgi:hypothetical protein